MSHIIIFRELTMTRIEKTIISVLALCLILLSSIPSPAEGKENKLDLFFLSGYGIPSGGYFLGQSEEYDPAHVPIKRKDHHLNYGKGIQLEGGANLSIMENVSSQFSFCYTGGLPRNEIEYKSNDTSMTTTYHCNLFGFKLMVLPHFLIFELFEMYIGIGAGLYFTSLKSETDFNQISPKEGYLKTKPGLAFCSLIGVDYPFNDKISGFFEISFDQMSFKTKEEKRIGYSTKFTYEKNSNSNSQWVLPQQKIPGSSVGLRIGIRYIILSGSSSKPKSSRAKTPKPTPAPAPSESSLTDTEDPDLETDTDVEEDPGLEVDF